MKKQHCATKEVESNVQSFIEHYVDKCYMKWKELDMVDKTFTFLFQTHGKVLKNGTMMYAKFHKYVNFSCWLTIM
jgi:hypothetical protein